MRTPSAARPSFAAFLSAAILPVILQLMALTSVAPATARAAAMPDEKLRAQFRLLDWEESLIHDDPGFRDASPTSRLDAFFVEGADASGLKFTE